MAQIDFLTTEHIDRLVAGALAEDLGSGDITTDGLQAEDQRATARVTAREAMVLCGLDIFRRVFTHLSDEVTFEGPVHRDGDSIDPQNDIIHIQGMASILLKGERTALNILQRLSGIATLTRHYVEAARPITILDTRKTTPGLRMYEKYAVHCGGGTNHRFGLFDAILIKDNHIQMAGGILQAIGRIRNGFSGKIEVEASNLREVEEALEGQADIIMLDNFAPEAVQQAVEMIDGKAEIEVSGNISLDKLRDLKNFAIDYISVGALTHSARSVDISMNLFFSQGQIQ